MEKIALDKFFTDQLSVWPLCATNFRSLKSASVKEFAIGGMAVKVQCNPCRIQSTLAAVPDCKPRTSSCFLCEDCCPPEQNKIRFEGRKGRVYNIRVNPYPIFPHHFVISRNVHVDQSIWHCYVDMLDMAKSLQGCTIFYNGMYSGASRPDHMHFQACPCGSLPLENLVNEVFASGDDAAFLCNVKEARLYHLKKYVRGVFMLRATTAKSMAKLFYRFLDCVPLQGTEDEPRFNLFTWYASGEYRTAIVLRSKLRPHNFDASGDEHFTMSLGAADVAGFFIVPVPEEFDRISADVLSSMMDEVTVDRKTEDDVIYRLTRSQKTISVGIMSAPEVCFEMISDGAGPQKVVFEDGKINYNGVLYDELYFDAVTPSSLFAEPTFILYDVTIGVDFHWQRREPQKFAGALKFIASEGKVIAINIVGVEDYLLSVISSEMKSTASVEFLKAHAVISRSWVMAQIGKGRAHAAASAPVDAPAGNDDVIVKWFDHEDHDLFDVCADDHCQRYQGLSRALSGNARKAVDATWGEVLEYDGEICDARFSKCCGGRMELFSTCWEDKDYPYLVPNEDRLDGRVKDFCDTHDRTILSQVLNDYDLETNDFYRWSVRYSRSALSALVKDRSGIDFGEIRALVPLKRGPSGRICLLRIDGTLRSMTIGKELLIRRYLSTSHLKSSAFDVICDGDDFILEGRGWGHGVGLCQIGAAVMAHEGYDYKRILEHYYPGATLTRR